MLFDWKEIKTNKALTKTDQLKSCQSDDKLLKIMFLQN